MKQKSEKNLKKDLTRIRPDLNEMQMNKVEKLMFHNPSLDVICDQNKDIAYLRHPEHTLYICVYCCEEFKSFRHLHIHVVKKCEDDDEPGKLVIDDEMPGNKIGGPNRGIGLMVPPKGIPACPEAECKYKCENCSRKFRHRFSKTAHEATCPCYKLKRRSKRGAEEQQPAPSKQFKPDPIPTKAEFVFKSELMGPHLLELPTMNDITFVDLMDVKFHVNGGWKKESDFMDKSMDTSTWTYPEVDTAKQ